jgi:hypothetical protein
MKTLTLEADGSISAKDGNVAWSFVNVVEAAKQQAEFTAPELAASPVAAAQITSPATAAKLALQRAALVKS